METASAHRRPQEDPRVAQTRQLVLSAARTLLVEEGQESVTPTRLAELTGISRSTIYRHWNDPIDIVFEATAADTSQSPFTPTGDPRTDLTGYLEGLRDMLESPYAKLLVTQIDRAEHSPKTVETLRAIAMRRRELIRDLVDHPTDDFAIEHALIVGPLIYQRFMAQGEISDDLIARVVDDHFSARERPIAASGKPGEELPSTL